MKSLSRVRLFATPWTVAYQAPLSRGNRAGISGKPALVGLAAALVLTLLFLKRGGRRSLLRALAFPLQVR